MAAATASMKAERTARASRVRMPAAVVPAGEVTSPAAPRGPAGLLEKRGRAHHRLDHQGPADVPGQAHLHARLDERLGDQEEVGRARAREAGHRIEQALGQADDGARRPTGRPRPRPGRPTWRRTRRRWRVTPAPTRAGVLGMARTTAGSPPSAASRRAHGHAGHDGEDPGDPGGAEGAAGALGRVGLDRQHGAGDPLAGAVEQPGLGRGDVRRPGWTPPPARPGAPPPARRRPGRPTPAHPSGAARPAGRRPSSRRRR